MGVVIDDKTPWDDFPFLACEELWQRLTPHLLCPEIVASRIERAIERPLGDVEEYDAAADGKDSIEAASMLMDYLETFAPDEREAAFEEVMNCSVYEFGGWLEDIAFDYGQHYLDQARRIAEVMAETTYAEILWTDLAVSLIQADRTDEAVQLAEQNLARWPMSYWVRIKSGDVYRDAGDTDTAIKLHTGALKTASKPHEWEGTADRLRPLLRRLGRREEWDRLKQEHPKPADPPIIPFPDESRLSSPAASRSGAPGRIGVLTSGPSPKIVTVPEPSVSSAKIGRNDPCPCGSGKKYKKCCMGRD